MAYTPKTWTTGETITAAELNAIEQGTQAAAAAADTATSGLTSKVNSSTYTAGLAGKADLTSGVVPDAQLPTRLSTSGLNSAIDARGTANGWGSGANAAGTGYDIVLLMGQSNMTGQNSGTDSRTDPVDGRISGFDYSGTYGQQVAGAQDPLVHQSGATGVGPGMAFARWYVETVPGRKVLLVPAAAVSTALVAGQWDPATRGGLYDKAVAVARAALTAAGSGGRIVAALWVQGESDGDSGVGTSAYATTLDALIAQLRTDLAIAHLPFLIGGMLPEAISTRTGYAAIAAAHADTPNRTAYTAYAPGVTGFDNGDNLHYNAAGQRRQGRALAAAYPTAVANSNPTPPAIPGQVTGLAAGAPTVSAVPLSWTAVTGATSYKVEQSSNGGSTWATAGTAATTTYTATGLSSATAYSFRVSAVNSTGTGTPSSTVSATTAAGNTAPGQPTGLTAGTPTAATVPLSWTAPASNGGTAITDYVVQYRTTAGPGAWQTFTDGTSTTASTTVTGLTASTEYDFRVAAVNSVGTGTYSATATATTAAAAGGGADSGPALTIVRGTPVYTAGKIGNAESGAAFAPATTVNLTGAITMEMWVRNPGSGIRVAIGDSTRWFGTNDGVVASQSNTSGTSINDGLWHHIAYTFDGTNEKLWVDGQNTVTGGSNGTYTGANLAIGGYSPSNGSFDWTGQIDEVRLSNVVRYTTAFTPPTTAFTADANTVALYHLDS